ncbi:integrase_H2C2 domain-containing protein [Trichonephila clavipes]|nr:integrase_H2C2 domain-containing protein [Trichonephila clavipes]
MGREDVPQSTNALTKQSAGGGGEERRKEDGTADGCESRRQKSKLKNDESALFWEGGLNLSKGTAKYSYRNGRNDRREIWTFGIAGSRSISVAIDTDGRSPVPKVTTAIFTSALLLLFSRKGIWRMRLSYPTEKGDTFPRLEKGIVPINIMEFPHCLKAKILESVHSEYGGHLKFFKTYHRPSENFFWHNMYKDTKNFVRSCTICLSRKNAFKNSACTPSTSRTKPKFEGPYRVIERFSNVNYRVQHVEQLRKRFNTHVNRMIPFIKRFSYLHLNNLDDLQPDETEVKGIVPSPRYNLRARAGNSAR